MPEPSAWPRLKANLQAVAGWIAKSASVNNIVGLTWIVIWFVISVLIAQDISRAVVTIEPISVPKTLSDGGYTPEVASNRMLDAVSNFYDSIKGSSSRPIDEVSVQTIITPRDEQRDFIVPTIGLSLNTIVASIRSVLHYGSGPRISGEIIIHDNLAWLRLRVDGQQVFTSSTGVAVESLDEQLAAAAPAVVERINPYFAAVALYPHHPEQAVEKAREIIARVDAADANVRLKESDANVQGAYALKGDYLFDRGNFAEAEQVLRVAISLNWSNSALHNRLGRVLQRQGRLDDAVTQYQRAIGINPGSAVAHNNLGLVFSQQGKRLEAAAQYRRAVEIDPKNAIAHNNLGLALYHQGNADAAIAEYRRAIAINPNYALAHNNLGNSLRDQGNADDAIAEYHRAVEIAPNLRNARENLEKALQAKTAAK